MAPKHWYYYGHSLASVVGACAEQSVRCASSADGSSQMMMADSGSNEEVAVIGNTDITSTELENNIINTVVTFALLSVKHFRSLKSLFSLVQTFQNRPNVMLARWS